MFCVTYKLENIFLPEANNHRVKYWIRSLVQCQVEIIIHLRNQPKIFLQGTFLSLRWQKVVLCMLQMANCEKRKLERMGSYG